MAATFLMSYKIDFATMKRWVPDYAKISSTNLWSGGAASGGSATMTETGWVNFRIAGLYGQGHKAGARVYINGKRVFNDTNEAASSTGSGKTVLDFGGTLQVSKDDIVSYDSDWMDTDFSPSLYFIPGKWV